MTPEALAHALRACGIPVKAIYLGTGATDPEVELNDEWSVVPDTDRFWLHLWDPTKDTLTTFGPYGNINDLVKGIKRESAGRL
jgi:hypothetical protein